MSQKKILIVDDEPDILETTQFQLEQENYEVLTAINGWEALGAVRATEPNLVVLDVMMPKENGYRVCKMIKNDVSTGKILKKTPVILLTARKLDTDPEREGMFEEFSQADLILYKPFDFEALQENIEKLLDSTG
jgi:two-component system, OmpR family, alkaline phosphatase synthesis response regulator PhoP